jgi:hypothetical protein
MAQDDFFNYFYDAQKQLGSQLERELTNLQQLGEDTSNYGVEYDVPEFDRARGTIKLGARLRKLTLKEMTKLKQQEKDQEKDEHFEDEFINDIATLNQQKKDAL